MKKHLQLILSLLCVLALVFGITAAMAEENEARIITIKWYDGNNSDNIRPASVTASLAGQEVELTADNGWSAEVTVPAATSNDGWQMVNVPDGYTVEWDRDAITVAKLYHNPAQTTSVQAHIVWEDDHNAKGLRPETVKLILKKDGVAYGEPKAGAAAVSWTDLPSVNPGTNTAITYTVEALKDPAGYTSSVSENTVTFTLNTVNVTINAELSGYPEGTDLSGLLLVVDGPDPTMPKTLRWADVSDSYTFEKVLPGAYLVRDLNADTLVEGYIMDKENSKVCDAAYIAEKTGSLTWKYTYKEPTPYEEEEGYNEEEFADYDPWGNVGSLTFEILGPDEKMPITVNLSSFSKIDENTYRYEDLPDLVPGVYTVVERNAETLVKYYTLTSDSVTAMKIEVTADGSRKVRLSDQYAPAPTPEPDAEFVEIPVTKTWNDNGNADGNRPESITVRLYADGVEVDQYVLTAAEGWNHTFIDKPRYQDDNKTEIVYSVNEDPVNMYTSEINGYNIVNYYLPEVTSRSVAKVWQDNDDQQKIRPVSIVMILKNNKNETVATVVLNKENGWTATVSNLPTVIDGKKAEYKWEEQSVLGYSLLEVVDQNGTMTFINTVWERPEQPPAGHKPKTRGKEYITLDDYDTPLGVDVIINHVGDCFD